MNVKLVGDSTESLIWWRRRFCSNLFMHFVPFYTVQGGAGAGEVPITQYISFLQFYC